MSETRDMLKGHVASTARRLGGTLFDEALQEWKEDGNDPADFDENEVVLNFLNNTLDLEYRIGSDGELRGARLLVAFGGPNIWVTITPMSGIVEGLWGCDNVEMFFEDGVELWETIREVYACTH